MFDAVPSKNIGLEWEPCHQMVSLIDPIPQLRKWVGRVYHVHGKDATIALDVLETPEQIMDLLNGPQLHGAAKG